MNETTVTKTKKVNVRNKIGNNHRIEIETYNGVLFYVNFSNTSTEELKINLHNYSKANLARLFKKILDNVDKTEEFYNK